MECFKWLKQWDCEYFSIAHNDDPRRRRVRVRVSVQSLMPTQFSYYLNWQHPYGQRFWYSLNFSCCCRSSIGRYTAMNTRHGSCNIRCVGFPNTNTRRTARYSTLAKWMKVMRRTAIQGEWTRSNESMTVSLQLKAATSMNMGALCALLRTNIVSAHTKTLTKYSCPMIPCAYRNIDTQTGGRCVEYKCVFGYTSFFFGLTRRFIEHTFKAKNAVSASSSSLRYTYSNFKCHHGVSVWKRIHIDLYFVFFFYFFAAAAACFFFWFCRRQSRRSFT